MRPFIVCIMPTYGRVSTDPDIIGESVYWFTRQTYMGNVQLLILNDCPTQQLHCATPNVHIINLSHRLPTLGHKYNMLNKLAVADIILPWEDDDISLPWRIEDTVAGLSDLNHYWNPKTAYFQNGADAPLTLCSPHSVHHNASGYRKVIRELGVSYPEDTFGGVRQDAAFDHAARNNPSVLMSSIPATRPGYVYRWQIGYKGVRNLSGYHNPYDLYTNQPLPEPGNYEIIPAMGRDYEKEVA